MPNHRGRQLDRTLAPLNLIAPVREAVGRSFPLLADPAVRHSADLAITLALGADAAVPGRAYRYGLTPAANPASTRPLT